MLTTSPLPQASTTPYLEVYPEIVVPLGEKENTGVGGIQITQHCGSFLGRSHFCIAPQRAHRNLWGLTTGNLIVMEKGEKGLQKPELGSWQTNFLPAVPKQ